MLILVFLLLLVFFFVSSYGVVVTNLSSTPGNKNAKITIESGKNKKEFTLNLGERKISLIKRSGGQVKASVDNAYSGILIKFGLLGYKNIGLSVQPQKATESVGLSNGSCAADGTGYVIYYRCGANGDYVNATNNGVRYFANVNSSLNPATTVVKPYQEGYLTFNKSNDRLNIQAYSIQKNAHKKLGNTTISFKGSISTGVIASDSSASKSEKFVVFDDSNKVMTIFKSAADKTPQTLNLQENLNSDTKSKFILYMSGESVLLFNGSEVFEDEGELLVTDEVEQRLLFINASSPKTVKEQRIDGKFKLTSLAGNANGTAVFHAYSDTPEHKNLYIADGNNVQKIELPGNPGQIACWKDNNTLYLTLNDAEVLSYSIEDKYYHLVYKSGDKTIFGASCYGGNVYLSQTPRNLPVSDSRLEFIKILDEDLSGKRLETFLPLGPGTIMEIDSAFSFRKNIYVDLIDTDVLDFTQDPTNRPLPKPKNPAKIQKTVIDYFKNQDVDTDIYKFVFSY